MCIRGTELVPADAFTGDWRDPVVTHDGDCPKRGRRRCLGVDPSLPRLAAPVVGQGCLSAEHREGSLEAPRVCCRTISAERRAHRSWDWSRASSVINAADAIGHVRSRRVYPFCTYSIDFVRVWSIWSARIIGSSCRSGNRGGRVRSRQDRGPRATGATRVLNTCLYLGFLADLADSAHRFSENIREFANSGRTTPAASTNFVQ